MRVLVATLFLLFAGSALAQLAPSARAKLYAVVFQATVNSSGKIETLKVAKVLDPSSGTTNPVDVPVPQSYVTAARAFLSKRTYSTDPKEFFTYTFYDPSQPTRADIDPKAGRK
jgi:type II secretory pathway component PulC